MTPPQRQSRSAGANDRRCIYCLEDASKSKNRAHILPEAVVANDYVLPLGVECDKCNKYAGKKLEPMLVRHPHIAIPILRAGVPGKKGRIRKALGNFQCGVIPGTGLSYEVDELPRLIGPRGVVLGGIRIPPDRQFDHTVFSRALHHIGLSSVAANDGADVARRPEFDPVRTYVKAPERGQARWAYLQVGDSVHSFAPGCQIDHARKYLGWVMGLRFFNTWFYIDLLNTGIIESEAFCRDFPGAMVIGPIWVPPTPAPRADRPAIRYRVAYRAQ